jgi:uncharacterized protein
MEQRAAMTDALAATPTSPSERHELIDALRGFALAGVLMVNLASFTQYEFLGDAARARLPSAAFDAIATQAVELFVNVKFITLFSLLFGLGFALQLERAQARGMEGLWRYARRLLVLLGFGFVHSYFVWWGDILLTYAVVGLLMLPFRNLSDRALLVAGFAITVLPPLVAPNVRALLPTMPTQAIAYAEGAIAFASADVAATFRANVDLANWARVSNWALVLFVLSRFLFGYWAGRRGLLQAPERHRAMLRGLFAGSVVAGVALTALSFVQAPLRAAYPTIDTDTVKLLIRMLLRLGPLAIGVAYACGFALLYLRPGWARRLNLLAPVGRMALTNYLSQSVLGVMLFYGVGAGIGPASGMPGLLVAWALVFGAQVAWSRAWLARFRYGPAEWLWRWLTYGARPRFVRDPEPTFERTAAET